MNCVNTNSHMRAIWFGITEPENKYNIWLQYKDGAYTFKIFDRGQWCVIASGGQGDSSSSCDCKLDVMQDWITQQSQSKLLTNHQIWIEGSDGEHKDVKIPFIWSNNKLLFVDGNGNEHEIYDGTTENQSTVKVRYRSDVEQFYGVVQYKWSLENNSIDYTNINSSSNNVYIPVGATVTINVTSNDSTLHPVYQIVPKDSSGGVVGSGTNTWAAVSSATEHEVTFTMPNESVTVYVGYYNSFIVQYDDSQVGCTVTETQRPRDTTKIQRYFHQNTSYNVTATASTGYSITGCTVNSSSQSISTGQPFVVPVSSGTDYTVVIKSEADNQTEDEYCTVTLQLPANGTATLMYNDSDYDFGDVRTVSVKKNDTVTLSSTPYSGYVFGGFFWSTNNTTWYPIAIMDRYASFLVTNDVYLKAEFKEDLSNKKTIHIAPSYKGSSGISNLYGNVQFDRTSDNNDWISQDFSVNSTATLVATPNEIGEFVGWYESDENGNITNNTAVSEYTTYNVRVNDDFESDTYYIALFKQGQYKVTLYVIDNQSDDYKTRYGSIDVNNTTITDLSNDKDGTSQSFYKQYNNKLTFSNWKMDGFSLELAYAVVNNTSTDLVQKNNNGSILLKDFYNKNEDVDLYLYFINDTVSSVQFEFKVLDSQMDLFSNNDLDQIKNNLDQIVLITPNDGSDGAKLQFSNTNVGYDKKIITTYLTGFDKNEYTVKANPTGYSWNDGDNAYLCYLYGVKIVQSIARDNGFSPTTDEVDFNLATFLSKKIQCTIWKGSTLTTSRTITVSTDER